MRGVGEVDHRDAALIPGLHQDVAPGNRNQRSVVRHAILKLGLRRGHLVIRRQRQLAFRDVENGVGAPVHRIGGAATRLAAAAPFVGEQDLGAGVVEVGGMPESVVGIADGGDADGIHGVRNVQHDSVSGTRAGREPDGRIDGNVVALVGDRGFLRAVAVVATLPETIQAPVFASAKMRGLETIFASSGCARGTLIMSMRNNAVLGFLSGSPPEQSGQLFRLANVAGAGNINVDVVFILRVDHQRVGVRAAAALDGRDLLGIREVGDIENTDAAKTVGAGGGGGVRPRPRRRRQPRRSGRFGGRRRRRDVAGGQRDALRAAIDASVGCLRRHEQQMAVDRNIALAAGAKQRRPQLDLLRIVDVVKIDAVIIPDKQMVAAEGQIGVGRPVVSRGCRSRLRAAFLGNGRVGIGLDGCEAGRFGQRDEQLQSERGLAGVI